MRKGFYIIGAVLIAGWMGYAMYAGIYNYRHSIGGVLLISGVLCVAIGSPKNDGEGNRAE